jgi:HEAT repeat protein
MEMEAVQRRRDFVDKLIAALNHPEPETRARAALILGLRREMRGVDALIRVVRRAHDASLVEVAIEALGRIGDPRSREAIEWVATRGTLRVRQAARQALALLRPRVEPSGE